MKLPQTWSEVNIGQYIELSKLKNEGDAIEYQISIISILSGKTYGEVSRLPIDELKESIRQTAFIQSLPTGKLKNNLQLNSRQYKINYDLTKLFAGEYIDLKSWTKTPELTQENLHNILALFIKPVKRNWFYRPVPVAETLEQRQEKANEFLQHLSVDVAYPMAVFFCTLLSNLTSATLEYTLKKTREKTRSLRQQIASQLTTNIGAGL